MILINVIKYHQNERYIQIKLILLYTTQYEYFISYNEGFEGKYEN